ncbi:hypothetical protein [Arsenicibacter rosenii]|uniref:Uncharacterized protein n=1 Tax=Arsenicibacter rosenii TaxID=1750698 RepID=A0A1S2VPB0_9BACT|nr:hypothetical protein [Arsenicibacter rosenii]OIN59638.1 hypothetical protein BLX24_07140 [Arsenicibacter rosenii]
MRFDDDDDEPFDWDDFEENYDPEAAQRELEAENRRIESLPVLKKAQEVLDITQAIADTIDKDADILMMHEQMIANAMMLAPKIVGAEGGDLYTIRMENAVLIKIHARELLTQTNYLRAERLCDPAYIKLLREEIEQFRVLFVEWVKSFDRTNDIQDNWGLFY